MTARVVVFISGSGTILQAIIDAIRGGELDVEVSLLVSNRRGAYGLVRAETAAIPALYFPLNLIPTLDWIGWCITAISRSG